MGRSQGHPRHVDTADTRGLDKEQGWRACTMGEPDRTGQPAHLCSESTRLARSLHVRRRDRQRQGIAPSQVLNFVQGLSVRPASPSKFTGPRRSGATISLARALGVPDVCFFTLFQIRSTTWD